MSFRQCVPGFPSMGRENNHSPWPQCRVSECAELDSFTRLQGVVCMQFARLGKWLLSPFAHTSTASEGRLTDEWWIGKDLDGSGREIIEVLSQYRSRDSVVGITTGYGLDDRGIGVRVSVGSTILSSPRRPDRLWGPPNLLSNGYGGLFPRGKAAGAWSWTLTSS
jgi:hypothetical protein